MHKKECRQQTVGKWYSVDPIQATGDVPVYQQCGFGKLAKSWEIIVRERDKEDIKIKEKKDTGQDKHKEVTFQVFQSSQSRAKKFVVMG